MQEAVAAPHNAVDSTGIVTADLPCRSCSYNLRGLHQDSNCPECATEIKLSLRGHWLYCGDPDWVWKLKIGTRIILGCSAVTMVMMCLPSPLGFLIRPLQSMVWLAVAVVSAVGTWLLTAPDPAGYEGRNLAIARHVARWGLIVGIARVIIQIWPFPAPHPTLTALLGIVLVLSVFARIAGEVARLCYIEQIARRLPNEELARSSRRLMWGYGISFATLTLLGAALSFMTMTLKIQPSGLRTTWRTVAWISRIASLVTVVFLIRYALLLVELQGQLWWAESGLPVHKSKPGTRR